MNQPSLQETVDEQSRTITRLCEAIDPMHAHGPETDKLCDYAKRCREFYENGILIKRIESLEALSNQNTQIEGMLSGRIMDGPMPICHICGYPHITSKCPPCT